MTCTHSLFFGVCYTKPLIGGDAGLVVIAVLLVAWAAYAVYNWHAGRRP